MAKRQPDDTPAASYDDVHDALRALRKRQRKVWQQIEDDKERLKCSKAALDEINADIGAAIDSLDAPGLPFTTDAVGNVRVVTADDVEEAIDEAFGRLPAEDE